MICCRASDKQLSRICCYA